MTLDVIFLSEAVALSIDDKSWFDFLDSPPRLHALKVNAAPVSAQHGTPVHAISPLLENLGRK